MFALLELRPTSTSNTRFVKANTDILLTVGLRSSNKPFIYFLVNKILRGSNIFFRYWRKIDDIIEPIQNGIPALMFVTRYSGQSMIWTIVSDERGVEIYVISYYVGLNMKLGVLCHRHGSGRCLYAWRAPQICFSTTSFRGWKQNTSFYDISVLKIRWRFRMGDAERRSIISIQISLWSSHHGHTIFEFVNAHKSI